MAGVCPSLTMGRYMWLLCKRGGKKHGFPISTLEGTGSDLVFFVLSIFQRMDLAWW